MKVRYNKATGIQNKEVNATKALIAYYSRRGENYVNGEIKTLKIGNTEFVASLLQKITGAELYRIEREPPYSARYYRCIDEARQELYHNTRPPLKNPLPSLDEYDTIFLGYPNYWGTMPMPVFSFLEQSNTAGKLIRPFCTSEGGGLGCSIEDIRRLCPNATVTEGFAALGSRLSEELESLEQWAAQAPDIKSDKERML